MAQLKFLNVFAAIIILLIAGLLGYFLGVRTSQAPVILQGEIPAQ